MKSIALAQQLWLLTDYVKKNPDIYGEKIPSDPLFIVDTLTLLTIPWNPWTPAILELESYGFGPASFDKSKVTLPVVYHNDHKNRSVMVMRLETPVVKRGKEHKYATLYYTPRRPGINAVRYSTSLYAALFKARPALTQEVKYRPAFLEPEGVVLVDFAEEALAIRLNDVTEEEIESLALGGSLQDNLRA